MEMQFAEANGSAVVALAGRMDTAGVAQIELRFSTLVMPRGRNTVVDMAGVEFLASLGIRLLITAARSLAVKGAKLVVFGVRPAVMEVIETTGMKEVVPVVETEAEAFALLAA